jgi:hypothetical protein
VCEINIELANEKVWQEEKLKGEKFGRCHFDEAENLACLRNTNERFIFDSFVPDYNEMLQIIVTP